MAKQVKIGRDKSQQRENDSYACHVYYGYKLTVLPTPAGTSHFSKHATQTLPYFIFTVTSKIKQQSITMSSSNATPDPSPSPPVQVKNPHTGHVNHDANKEGAMSLCACKILPQCMNLVAIRGVKCQPCVEICPDLETEALLLTDGTS